MFHNLVIIFPPPPPPPPKHCVDIISYFAPSINVHFWPFVKQAKTFMSLKKPKIQQTGTQAQNQRFGSTGNGGCVKIQVSGQFWL
jgi:hypothetical protein